MVAVLQAGQGPPRSGSWQVVELGADEWVQAGYRDDHVHILAAAAAGLSVSLAGVATIADLLDTVADAASSARGWGRLWGYDDALLAENRHPTKDDLDAVTGSWPVLVHHRTGHVVVANTAALSELGADPADAPDGVLVERHDVLARTPPLDPTELRRAAGEVLEEMSSQGVVACTDATHTNDCDRLVLLDGLTGSGRPRLTAMVAPKALVDLPGYGERVGSVEVGPAKVMPLVVDDESLVPQIDEARRHSFPVAVHVMDIDTLEVTLRAMATSSMPGDRIEHCAMALPEQLDRLAELEIAVCTQPGFVVEREHVYRHRFGATELGWLWPLRSLLDRSVNVTLGSDGPVTSSDPARWIAAASNRNLATGERVDPGTAESLAAACPVDVGCRGDELVIGDGRRFRPLVDGRAP